MSRILLCFLSSLLLLACTPSNQQTSVSPIGIWKQDGYGKIVQIQDSIIRVFDICQVDCHLAFEEEILDFGRIIRVTKDSLTIKHNIDRWQFARIDRLPELCAENSSEKSESPVHNFETFWHTFNEHYCSFNIKKVDWHGVYNNFHARVTEETSSLELFEIFEEMTTLLDDGHIDIEVPEEIEEQYVKNQVEIERKYTKLDEFELHKSLAQIYVDSLRNYNGGVVRWGMIDGDVGYIQFNTMWMIANFDLNPELGLMETYEGYVKHAEQYKDEELREEEENGANEVMETIFTDLSNAKSYILDLRFNGGGKDCVAMQIMNRFFQEKLKVASKHVRFNESLTAYQDIEVIPPTANFDGPVVILTSHFTASAAEVAVLASMPHPSITRIGSKTEGLFSSTLDKTLPNGWTYELSNEIYIDLEGNNYEHVGIAADIELDYSDNMDTFLDHIKDGIEKGSDGAIEIALSTLKK